MKQEAINLPKEGWMLVEGQHYTVESHRPFTEKDSRPFNFLKARRVYKGEEIRFDKVLCYVFSSRVGKDVTCKVTSEGYNWSGKRIPASELSIPYYDLISVERL